MTACFAQTRNWLEGGLLQQVVDTRRKTTKTCDTHTRLKRSSIMSRLQIAKLGYVIAAGASFLLSIWLWFNGNRESGVFVGLWVPSILSFGVLMMLTRSSHE